jgi:hypothetical protein
MKLSDSHELIGLRLIYSLVFGLFSVPVLISDAKAQVGTANDPFVAYYSLSRDCVRSEPTPADANGLSKGWSYECVAQDEVVFVLSLIDKCPSVAINTVRRNSPDNKKIDIICIFLASDVKGSEMISRKSKSEISQQAVPSQPAMGFDGCPIGSSKRIKKGFLGMGGRDYGCLTDYEYADIQQRERASNSSAWSNFINSTQPSKPAYCYGSSYTTGSYGMSQTTANASCF